MRIAVSILILLAAPVVAQAPSRTVPPGSTGARPPAVAAPDAPVRRPRPPVLDRNDQLRGVLEGLIRDVVTPPPRPAPPPPQYEPYNPPGGVVELPEPVVEPEPVPPPRTIPAPPRSVPPRANSAPAPAPKAVAPRPERPAQRQPPAERPSPPAPVEVSEPPPELISQAPLPAPVVALPQPVEPATPPKAPPTPAVEPATTALGARAFGWWPLLLLLAIGAAEWARRRRRLARTRAVLAIAPRLESAEGAHPSAPLEFAAPPLRIRSRLELGPVRA